MFGEDPWDMQNYQTSHNTLFPFPEDNEMFPPLMDLNFLEDSFIRADPTLNF